MKKAIRIKKTMAWCIILALLFSIISNTFKVSALSYSGSGTVQSPYLVQTAEQLQGMRENLSANYKLANNIDLSGTAFKAIGHLDIPFTGSFVCELNADNTPKYAIKKLSVSVAETAYSIENQNKWEAALFGATNGATISGIFLFDVKISNQNLGDDTGSAIYNTFKPGMDEMASAALIGIAKSTTVSNCASTGEINTRSNHCGGLIGRLLDSSSVDYSFSTASVYTVGKWCIGGLVGTINQSVVTNSYATGSVGGTPYGAAGILGSITDSTVKNCFSSGNVERGSSFVYQEGGSNTLSDCVTNSKVANLPSKVKDKKSTLTNCLFVANSGCNEPYFTSSDGATVTAKINAIKAKVGSGAQASSYVPETVNNSSTKTSSSGGSTTATESTATQSSVGDTGSQAAQIATPDQVISLLQALPEEESITVDDKNTIIAAYKAYDALSISEKDNVPADLVANLNKVRSVLSIKLVGDVVTGIKALPEIEKLTIKDNDTVLALWDEYNILTDNVKSEIDSWVVDKLQAAYDAISNMQDSTNTSASVSNMTTLEWIIVIFSGVIILVAVSFNVVATILLLRRFGKKGKKIIDVYSNAGVINE